MNTHTLSHTTKTTIASDLLVYLAAFVSGLLTVLAFAPFNWVIMPVITLGSWGVMVHRARSVTKSFFLGLAWGVGFFGLGVQWVYTTVHSIGGMPQWLAILMHILFAFYLSLFPAGVAFLLHKAKGFLVYRHHPYSFAVLWLVCFPLFWMLSELLRGEGHLGFNWLSLGYSQAALTPLAGWARWLGVYGVSFWVVMGAGAFVWLVHQAEVAALTIRHVLYGALFSVFVLLFGKWSLLHQWTTPAASLSVSLVQGNVEQSNKWDSAFQVAIFRRYTRLLNEAKGTLVVLPETAIPVLKHQLPKWWLEDLDQSYRLANRTVLLGVVEELPARSSASVGRYYNAFWTYGASGGQFYQKRHLVPFGEYIPGAGWLQFFSRWWDMPLAAFSRGDQDPKLLSMPNDVKVASTICYEDSFSGLLRGRFSDATLLLNISNDAWFGDGMAIDQHLQIAQMRSIETAKPMIRSNNTAGTAVISGAGKIDAYLKPFEENILEITVRTQRGITPFVRYGDWGIVVLSMVSILIIFMTRKNV